MINVSTDCWPNRPRMGQTDRLGIQLPEDRPADERPMMTKWNGNTFRITGPFVRGIHRDQWIPFTKGQWCGALMLPLMSAWTNSWTNNREAGELICLGAHLMPMLCVVLMDRIFHNLVLGSMLVNKILNFIDNLKWNKTCIVCVYEVR